jgi:hypothetical protein
MPQRRDLEPDIFLLAQALAQLGQSQIRLLFDPSAHLLFDWGQARNAVATNRSAATFTGGLKAAFDLVDPDPADLQTPGNIDRPLAALQSTQHPVTQIL